MLKHRINQILQSENDRSSLLNFVISVFCIFLFFHIRYGLGIFNPTETAWLMKYDWAQHYMGWYFYRFEPWTFPLGNINNLFYPIGTNIGFTDSIPLAAIPLKLLSPFLPEQFQYHGWWLCLTHILVAFFSIRLLNLFNIRKTAQLIAVLIITFNPALLHRAMHIALASHWVIVANLWVYFLDPKVVPKKKILLYQFLLLIAGGLINPYFALVNGGFLFILALKFWLSDKVFSLKDVAFYVSGSAALLVASWLITGFFNLSSTSYLGVLNAYGQFSWNMSSLWNPFTYDRHEDYYTHNLSSFLPAKELVRWEQYESFSYLGLGLLLLSAFVILLSLFYAPIRERVIALFKKTSIILLFFLTLAITLFAITNVVSYNDKILFTFPLPAFTKLFTDIFRASGRYIQLFYYVWFFFLVFIISKTFPRKNFVILTLALVSVIQFVDIQKMIFNKKLVYEPYQIKINEPFWDRIVKSSDALLFLPPLQSNYLTHDDWHYFSWLAAKNRKPVSVGHIARIDFQASNDFARKMLDQILNRKLDSSAVYVTLPGSYTQFLANYFSNKADIVMLDGYLVISPLQPKHRELLDVFNDIKKNTDQGFVQSHFYRTTPKAYPGILKDDASDLKSGVYEINEGAYSYILKGWCFVDDHKSHENDSVSILLRGTDKKVHYAPAERFDTPDVADYFSNPILAKSGFLNVIDTRELTNGDYQVGLEIIYKDNGTLKSFNKWLDYSISVLNPIRPTSINWTNGEDPIKSDINLLSMTLTGLKIEGWAFSESKLSQSELYITVSNDRSRFAYKTIPTERPDVASFFENSAYLKSGFSLRIDNTKLDPGIYTIGFLIHDVQKNVNYHRLSSRTFEITPSGSVELTPREVKAAAPTLIYSKPEPVAQLPPASENIKGFVDKISEQEYFISVEGWAFVDKSDDFESRISVVLRTGDELLKVPCKKRFRPDLKGAFQHTFQTDSSGFEIGLKREYFKKGEYELSILIEQPGKSFYLPLKDNYINF